MMALSVRISPRSSQVLPSIVIISYWRDRFCTSVRNYALRKGFVAFLVCSPQRGYMPRGGKGRKLSVLPVSQPDMTLSDQELFGDYPHDHCGVFGYGPQARTFPA